MSRRQSGARAAARESTIDGKRPKSMDEYFIEAPLAIVKRGELLNALRWYHAAMRARRWHRRLWRWLTGKPPALDPIHALLLAHARAGRAVLDAAMDDKTRGMNESESKIILPGRGA